MLVGLETQKSSFIRIEFQDFSEKRTIGDIQTGGGKLLKW